MCGVSFNGYGFIELENAASRRSWRSTGWAIEAAPSTSVVVEAIRDATRTVPSAHANGLDLATQTRSRSLSHERVYVRESGLVFLKIVY